MKENQKINSLVNALNLKFSSYKTNTFWVLALFTLGFIIAQLLRTFSFLINKKAFFIIVISLHLISLLASFINAVYILRVVNFKEHNKYWWLLINCIPWVFWACIVFLSKSF